MSSPLLERLRSGAIGLGVDANDFDVVPYVYSGFLVEHGGRYFWVTAEHCLSSLERQFKETKLTLDFRFVASNNNNKWPLIVAKSSLTRHSILEFFKTAYPDSTAEQIEKFDIAILEIDAITHSYLVERDVIPFTLFDLNYRKHPLSGNDEFGPSFGFFGFPDHGRSWFSDDSIMRLSDNLFPVIYDAESSTADEANSYFLWMKPCWTRADFDASIVGCSGGPLVSYSGSDFKILGVVSRQFPSGKFPEKIGFTTSLAIVDYIEQIVER